MNPSQFLRNMTVAGKTVLFYDILRIQSEGIADIDRLPFSIRILVENLLRHLDGRIVVEDDLRRIAGWQPTYAVPVEIPHHPARVLMQDFTGVPAVVDLAAMRDAMAHLGGDPRKVNPQVPVELVVDHSVQVDYFGTDACREQNVAAEYDRNGERYAMLKWAQKSFENFKVVPPNSGICHQVNLEHLGRIVITVEADNARTLAYPDTLVGLDSHTTMINGIGVMGWGVGGIEAEAVMLGQPYYMSIPEVVGVKLTGELTAAATATDLVLRVTEMLRAYQVVEKFVEFFGPGMKQLTVPDRATIANMAPEYGATMGFFPVDEKTLDYLDLTGRGERIPVVEAVTRALGLFYSGSETPDYTDVLELDLGSVRPSVAGPARPQDRIEIGNLAKVFAEVVQCEYARDAESANTSPPRDDSGCRTPYQDVCRKSGEGRHAVSLPSGVDLIGSGSVVIAAITSCTNTSNPSVMMGAGLLARNALARGLRVPPHVKTSLAPGSKVVVRYLEQAGLMPFFKALGFHPAAFGCTTCIGNSGPLHPEIDRKIREHDLTVAAVLSGNRNFEARIHQRIKANFLMSPMLVVAFAIAGRVDIDLNTEPLACDPNGTPVYLRDIRPADEEIERLVDSAVQRVFFEEEYGRIFDGDAFWQALPEAASMTFPWSAMSTYIRRPPFFDGLPLDAPAPSDIHGARVLLVLGDSVTTDHISPAGAIPEEYPAGRHLVEKGVPPDQFNSYGSRRGNHEVMMRGTFGNIRIKNQLAGGREGSLTLKFPEREEMYVYDAAMAYAAEQTPLIVLGGREYGSGSSRDWAAKGTALLGVGAVIAESFERIHRSNLVGMGVLPLVFQSGENAATLGFTGAETFSIEGLTDLQPRKSLKVRAEREDGGTVVFDVTARLDTDIEVDYYVHGGILPYVLRKLMANS